MQQILISLIIAVTLTACGTDAPDSTENGSADAQTETQRLNQWLDEQYEVELMFSPIQLTMQGRKERYSEIDDFGDAALDEQLEWKRQSVETMRSEFDYAALDDEAKLSYDLWAYQYDIAAKSREFRRHEYVFHQMTGTHSFLPTFMISFHRVESPEDMDAYISRLSAVGHAINQQVELAQLSADEGIRPPRFAYEIVREQTQAIIAGQPFSEGGEDNSLWADAQGKIGGLLENGLIEQPQAEQLQERARQALLTDLGPAYQNVVAFLDQDIANTGETAHGAGDLPNGKAYYDHMLAAITTTSLTADEIHELGLQEVERLRGEMEKVKAQAGFDGSLQEFFVLLREAKDNSELYFPDTDDGRLGYISEATAAIDNIKGELPNYFGLLPNADLVVKRVEPFREQDGAPQHYFPGTPDGSRPGIYYAHLSDMTSMPRYKLEVIAYHEGLPGHHMQISIAQELEDIPTFRTQIGFTSYIEGWALYSELLADEMPGTYLDAYSKFGYLSSDIWRAIRLVVDTGMHAKGWSQQQAVDYFVENTPEPLETAEAEVRRYLVIPGQATAYKIGMLDILRLRQMARDAMGDQFDIRAFHDVILGGGALPLNMLEQKVQRWIDQQTP